MTNASETTSRIPGQRRSSTATDTGRPSEFQRQHPPHMAEGTTAMPDTTQVESSDETFGLEPLHALPRSVPLYRVNTDSLVTGLELKPSLQGSYKFGRNATLWERRETALGHAASHLQRPALSHLSPAKRSVSRDIFPGITKTLSHLMTKVSRASVPASEDGLRGDTQYVPVYSLDRLTLATLSIHFDRMAKAASKSFEYTGQQLPSVPTWPREGGSAGSDFLLENDFKILAVTYRALAEDFLSRLVDIHDFRTGQMKLVPLIEEEVGDNPYVVQEATNQVEKAPRRSFGAGDFISTTVRSHCSKHHTYTSTAQGKSSYSHRSPNSHTKTLPRQSQRVGEMWDSGSEEEKGNTSEDEVPRRGKPNNPGGDPSDDDDDQGDGNGRRGGGQGNRRDNQQGTQRQSADFVQSVTPNGKPQFQFDLKLKFDTVPTWDGNMDNIMQWINEVNDLAKYGTAVRLQLGSIVPRRFRDSAKTWYYYLEKDWRLLREEIGGYYMNRKWSEDLRKKANRSGYLDTGHMCETPSEYYIRKLNLLTTAYDLADSELISEIMEGAPDQWNTILSTQNYKNVMEFQSAIRYYKDTLLKLESGDRSRTNNYRNEYDRDKPRSYTPRTYLVGTRTDLPPPAYPKDDSNVSKRTTPKDKGARPCRHCGSHLHWDKECKYSTRRTARTRLCETSVDNLQAQDDYDDLFDEQLLTEEEGFEGALQTTDERQGITGESALEGDSSSSGCREEIAGETSTVENAHTTASFQSTVRAEGKESTKPPLNQRSRRRMICETTRSSTTYAVRGEDNKGVLELKKRMERPLGCSFLGARATETTATINNLEESLPVVVDSGSDITLISYDAASQLSSKPRIKTGQKINLVQGPVKIAVDAYVVNGMSTPLILGNDFQEQYDLSIHRRDGQTYLSFGDTGIQEVFVERNVAATGANWEESYGVPDSLIDCTNPHLVVSNFSRAPLCIPKGEILGYGHNPKTWLDKEHRLSNEQKRRAEAHANLIRELVGQDTSARMVRSSADITSKAHRNAAGEDDPSASSPIEGGPKTAEVHVEEVSRDQLLQEIHIAEELSEENR
ncbi:hypothetical protein PQX77_015329 [Marasmius sp. AFHP31]|nr:hypothetical protein PQX77_015329 [Marasmius sp. AFHP31]